MELIEILLVAICDMAIFDSMSNSNEPFYKRFGCWFMIVILLLILIGGIYYLTNYYG